MNINRIGNHAAGAIARRTLPITRKPELVQLGRDFVQGRVSFGLLKDAEDAISDRVDCKHNFSSALSRIRLEHLGSCDELGIRVIILPQLGEWVSNARRYDLWLTPWSACSIDKYSRGHSCHDAPRTTTIGQLEKATPKNLAIIFEFEQVVAKELGIAKKRGDTAGAEILQALIDLAVLRESVARATLEKQPQ